VTDPLDTDWLEDLTSGVEVAGPQEGEKSISHPSTQPLSSGAAASTPDPSPPDQLAQSDSLAALRTLTPNDAQLAMELVADLRPRDQIARSYGYTPESLIGKLKDPAFGTILREAHKLWHSDSNTKERVRAKAGLLVEDMLLPVLDLFNNPETPSPVKMDSFKSLARIAAVDSVDKNMHEGGRMSIVINVPAKSGEDAKPIVIEGHSSGTDNGG